MINIVLDTNVFITALRSKQGASYKLFELVGTGLFEICLSVPLVVEYEDTAKRLAGTKILLTEQDVDNVIDYLCAVGKHHQVYYLWRPFLKDPGDDMVLELAVSAGCKRIITYNIKDFRGIDNFGIRAVTARDFLVEIGVLS